jgi:hypothetical protein
MGYCYLVPTLIYILYACFAIAFCLLQYCNRSWTRCLTCGNSLQKQPHVRSFSWHPEDNVTAPCVLRGANYLRRGEKFWGRTLWNVAPIRFVLWTRRSLCVLYFCRKVNMGWFNASLSVEGLKHLWNFDNHFYVRYKILWGSLQGHLLVRVVQLLPRYARPSSSCLPWTLAVVGFFWKPLLCSVDLNGSRRNVSSLLILLKILQRITHNCDQTHINIPLSSVSFYLMLGLTPYPSNLWVHSSSLLPPSNYMIHRALVAALKFLSYLYLHGT